LIAADRAGAGWLLDARTALAGRFRLVLLLAAVVIAVDHVAKLGAAGLQPDQYMHNPAPFIFDWVLVLPFALLLIPSRFLAVLLGVWFGGSASNTIDVYVWPGGVPDFIPMGDWVWNPADFAIYGAGIPLLFAVVAWPTWRLFRIARRRYPDRTTATSASSRTSDGVLDRKELPFEAEMLGQPLRERLHAEPFGRVVAARDEMDPELA
jgi:lipoprotein signal peptidase